MVEHFQPFRAAEDSAGLRGWPSCAVRRVPWRAYELPAWCFSVGSEVRRGMERSGIRRLAASQWRAGGVEGRPQGSFPTRWWEVAEPGCYGVSPLEWVAPHGVGARESPFPKSLGSKKLLDIGSNSKAYTRDNLTRRRLWLQKQFR